MCFFLFRLPGDFGRKYDKTVSQSMMGNVLENHFYNFIDKQETYILLLRLLQPQGI